MIGLVPSKEKTEGNSSPISRCWHFSRRIEDSEQKSSHKKGVSEPAQGKINSKRDWIDILTLSNMVLRLFT